MVDRIEIYLSLGNRMFFVHSHVIMTLHIHVVTNSYHSLKDQEKKVNFL